MRFCWIPGTALTAGLFLQLALGSLDALGITPDSAQGPLPVAREPRTSAKKKAVRTQRKALANSKIAAKTAPTTKSFDAKMEEAFGDASAQYQAREREKRTAESRAAAILRGSTYFRLSGWLGGYRAAMSLTPLFLSDDKIPPEVDYNDLTQEWKRVGPLVESLRKSQERQDSYARGDLEKSEIQHGVSDALKISLLRLRLAPPNQVAQWLDTEGKAWGALLNSFAFDEGAMASLRIAVDLRFLLWRELRLRLLAPEATDLALAQIRRQIQEYPAAWPVERLLVEESRRIVKPVLLPFANGIAHELQRNPWRSISEIRKTMRGGGSLELAGLDPLWTSMDVDRRKQEEDLINEVILRSAVIEYTLHQGKRPKTWDEVKVLGLLTGVPLCRRTGQPWQITQL